MKDNLIALLQIIDEFQKEYGVYFDIWSGDPKKYTDIQAVDSDDFNIIASIERK